MIYILLNFVLLLFITHYSLLIFSFMSMFISQIFILTFYTFSRFIISFIYYLFFYISPKLLNINNIVFIILNFTYLTIII